MQNFEKMCEEIFSDIFDRERKASEKFAPYRTLAVRTEMQHTLDTILMRVEGDPLGCWEWTGARTAKGYGRVKVYDGTRYRIALPHRVVAYAMGKLDSIFDNHPQVSAP